MDECFEVEEVKYGFRSKVTLLENSPCILGSTCKGIPTNQTDLENPINPEHTENRVNPEDAGNPENSINLENLDFPPQVNQDLIRKKLDLILDRQTGEEFQSDGPPDCRVVRLENCP